MDDSKLIGLGIVLLMFIAAMRDWFEARDHRLHPEKNRRRLEARWKRLEELYRVPEDRTRHYKRG